MLIGACSSKNIPARALRACKHFREGIRDDDDKRSCSDFKLSPGLRVIHRWVNYSQTPRNPLYAIEHMVINFRKTRAYRCYTDLSIQLTKKDRLATVFSSGFHAASPFRGQAR
jgi:hypothetical protein